MDIQVDSADYNASSRQQPDDVEPKAKIQYLKGFIKYKKILNMWPVEKGSCFRSAFHNFMVWGTVVSSVIIINFFFIQISLSTGNMHRVADIVDYVTVFVSATFRYLYIYFRGATYLILVNKVHNDFIHYSLFRGKNKMSLDRQYKLGKRIALSYISFTYCWVLQLCIYPIFHYIWENMKSSLYNPEITAGNDTIISFQVPIPIYFPMDKSTQPGGAIIYIYEVIMFLFFTSVYMLVDGFWFLVIMLTIGQFDLLKASIESVSELIGGNESGENEFVDPNIVQEVDRRLNECIKHHQFVREFVRLVDDLFNPNALVDTLHAIISIAFILLDATVSLNHGTWNKFIYSLQYFITSIVHMFIFDWLGNELAVREQELANVIYAIPWYRVPSQKTKIILISTMSKRPHKLTGGKMYSLSLEFFTSTVRVVFSYFSFLLQLQNV